jgi:hypothetical protein
MSNNTNGNINDYIYLDPAQDEPTRYEIIRFSTWRIHLFQELESFRK